MTRTSTPALLLRPSWLWLGVFASLIACGSSQDSQTGSSEAGASGVGQGTAGNAPVEVLPGSTSFTQFTLFTFAAELTGSNGECKAHPANDPSYASTWSFDRASRTLTWLDCNVNLNMLERGSIALPDSEVQTILNLLSSVTPTQKEQGDCRTDRAYVEMDLVVGEMTTRYRDSSAWCGATVSALSIVDGLFELWFRVQSSAHPR